MTSGWKKVSFYLQTKTCQIYFDRQLGYRNTFDIFFFLFIKLLKFDKETYITKLRIFVIFRLSKKRKKIYVKWFSIIQLTDLTVFFSLVHYYNFLLSALFLFDWEMVVKAKKSVRTVLEIKSGLKTILSFLNNAQCATNCRVESYFFFWVLVTYLFFLFVWLWFY